MAKKSRNDRPVLKRVQRVVGVDPPPGGGDHRRGLAAPGEYLVAKVQLPQGPGRPVRHRDQRVAGKTRRVGVDDLQLRRGVPALLADKHKHLPRSHLEPRAGGFDLKPPVADGAVAGDRVVACKVPLIKAAVQLQAGVAACVAPFAVADRAHVFRVLRLAAILLPIGFLSMVSVPFLGV